MYGDQSGEFFYVVIEAYKPFNPQYPNTKSPNRSPYISCKKLLKKFNKRSRHFLFGDHFSNSHNLFSCLEEIDVGHH